MSQFCVGGNSNSSNEVSVIRFIDADRRRYIQSSLSIPELLIRHHDIRADRVKGIGDWFLRTEEYQNWFDGIQYGELDNPVLFCSGDPGVGKTYIT